MEKNGNKNENKIRVTLKVSLLTSVVHFLIVIMSGNYSELRAHFTFYCKTEIKFNRKLLKDKHLLKVKALSHTRFDSS